MMIIIIDLVATKREMALIEAKIERDRENSDSASSVLRDPALVPANQELAASKLRTETLLKREELYSAKVKEVEMLHTETEDLRNPGGGTELDVRGAWIVSGSVGHWGHLHYRRNQYEARFTLRFEDGSWKITALEILEELRLTRP